MTPKKKAAADRFKDAMLKGAGQVAAQLQLRAEDTVINATMLGSVGVGKTTLLASMYERFGHVIGQVNLNVQPDSATSRTLSDYISKLKEMPTSINVTAGLEGTSAIRPYTFGVGTKGRPAAFKLRFTDFPGRYLLSDPYADKDKVERALADSDVILVAIDTPALMEQNGRFHERLNTPMVVTDEIKSVLSKNTDSKLVILTLLKCESYLTTPESTENLVQEVKTRYLPLLDHIAGEDVRARVGCVLTAVQTVGAIRLFQVDLQNASEPVFRFRSTRIGATYAPVDTEQPLRYLLRFVINKYRIDSRPRLKAIWELINGVDGTLLAAVEAFAAGCKTTGGFAILQDHPLLHSQTF